MAVDWAVTIVVGPSKGTVQVKQIVHTVGVVATG